MTFLHIAVSIVNLHETMAVVPLWLPPVLEWHKTEKKNGNSKCSNF